MTTTPLDILLSSDRIGLPVAGSRAGRAEMSAPARRDLHLSRRCYRAPSDHYGVRARANGGAHAVLESLAVSPRASSAIARSGHNHGLALTRHRFCAAMRDQIGGQVHDAFDHR